MGTAIPNIRPPGRWLKLPTFNGGLNLAWLDGCSQGPSRPQMREVLTGELPPVPKVPLLEKLLPQA